MFSLHRQPEILNVKLTCKINDLNNLNFVEKLEGFFFPVTKTCFNQNNEGLTEHFL